MLARRRDKLELVNKRLNEFYGPLYVASEAGNIAYRSLLNRQGKEKSDPILDSEMKEWMLWMTTIFMPLNDIREKIIIEKAYLIVEEQMPQCLLDFVTHVVGYKAVLPNGPKGDYGERRSTIGWPPEFDLYVRRSYAALKAEQTRLMHGAVWRLYHRHLRAQSLSLNGKARLCGYRGPFNVDFVDMQTEHLFVQALDARWERQCQVLPQAQRRFGLVDRVEMQSRRAIAQQRFAEPGHHAQTKVEQRSLVVLQLFKPQPHPARQIGAAAGAEAHRIGETGDRHDPRHNGNRDTRLAAALHEVEIGIGVIEELRQRAVRARLHLAAKIFEVRSRAACLRMHLRIRGYFDLESVAVRLANETDQLVRVVKLPWRSRAHRRRRQIAAQSHNALHTRFR